MFGPGRMLQRAALLEPETPLTAALRASLTDPPPAPAFAPPTLHPAPLAIEFASGLHGRLLLPSGEPAPRGPEAARRLAEREARTLAVARQAVERDRAAAAQTDTAAAGGPDGAATPIGRLLEEGAAHLAAAVAAARERDIACAKQARALAAFARCRPAPLLDRSAEEIGAASAATRAARPPILTEVSEWAVDEVMAAHRITAAAAARLLVQALTLVEELPATLAAAESGELPWASAVMLAEVLPRLTDPTIRATVEAKLLAGAAGRTTAQLRTVALRAVLRADPGAAARRAAEGIRERAVRLFTDPDGLATLSAPGLPGPVAAAIWRRLEALAEAAGTPGDPRTKAQRMADVFTDLLLRGVTGDTPPVQIALTLITTAAALTGGDEPGEIDGQMIPAPMVREVAYTLGLLPRPSTSPRVRPDPTQAAPPERAGEESAAADGGHGAMAEATGAGGDFTDGDATDRASAEAAPEGRPVEGAAGGSVYDELAADVARLLGVATTAGTGLAGLPDIAVIDEFTGQLLALTDAGEIRRAATCGRPPCRRTGDCPHLPRGPGLGPPPDTEGYRPAAALDGFVRARDRRCRFPGCRARPMKCDLDHNRPWPDGPTSHDNLCCLCRHHHRLAHQAPGWRLRRLPDGGLQWTTPSGEVLTTYPPPYGTDDQPPVVTSRTADDDPPF